VRTPAASSVCLGAQLVLDLGLGPAADDDPVLAPVWLPADRDRPGPAVPAPVVADRIFASGAALGRCHSSPSSMGLPRLDQLTSPGHRAGLSRYERMRLGTRLRPNQLADFRFEGADGADLGRLEITTTTSENRGSFTWEVSRRTWHFSNFTWSLVGTSARHGPGQRSPPEDCAALSAARTR
jgi:hypothetical protein